MLNYSFNTPSLIREFHYMDYNDLQNGPQVFKYTADQSQFSALCAEGFYCLPIASYFYNGCDDTISGGIELQIADPNLGNVLLGATTSSINSSQYLYTQHLPLGQNDITIGSFQGELNLFFAGFNGFPTPASTGLYWWLLFTYVPNFPN